MSSVEPAGPPPKEEITVEFPRGPASPMPAFASFVMVHRLPSYVLLDLGSIDPLSMTKDESGQRAVLQHVGRVCLPDATARQLMAQLAAALGSVD